MTFCPARVALPASWNLSFPVDHPVGLSRELAALPEAYQRLTGSLEGRIRSYYESQLERFRPSIHPTIQEDEEATLDDLARSLLEHRFQSVLDGRSEQEFPPYFYGYYEGQNSLGAAGGVYLRTVGLLPNPNRPILGTLVDLRGYGHGLDHDLDRTEMLLEAGFAVFTPERADHGLSSRIDPRNGLLRSTSVFARHTSQAFELIHEIRRRDPRLKETPVFAIASSMGAAQIIGAMRLTHSDLGLDALMLDNPMLGFGSKHPWWKRRLTRLLFGGLEIFPERYAETPLAYPKKSPPKRYEGMSDTRYREVMSYYETFGPKRHPAAFVDLEDLLEGNAQWLHSPEARARLPRTLLTFTWDDVEVDPDASLLIYHTFARTGRDALRETTAHSPFNRGLDTNLVPDIRDFFLGQEEAWNRLRLAEDPPKFF